ncbi:MAG: NADH-quinone oxidoreductase subunit C [Thermodesulfobacteriota bacterium]|nr:NADH-quinone oxidoreductase subunit C [Thermodesulfobacteriota bacterium]
MEPIRIAEQLQGEFQASIFGINEHRGQVTLLVDRNVIVKIISFLKKDHKMNHLSCLCGVDNKKRKAAYRERFEVVYQLYSIENRTSLRLKAQIPESDQTIDSITSLWTGANWLERETYDLLGIVFNNHPNLKRILTPEGWEGHPLLKEYKLRGDVEWKGFEELKKKAVQLRQFDFHNAPTAEEAGSDE